MAHSPAMPSPVALPGISKIVAIGSGKGGVGKTTVAVNLAIALSHLGQRVGLIDADIYGPNVPLMMCSSQPPVVGSDNRIVPNETHGIKTISIGYISPGDKPMMMRGPMLLFDEPVQIDCGPAVEGLPRAAVAICSCLRRELSASRCSRRSSASA